MGSRKMFMYFIIGLLVLFQATNILYSEFYNDGFLEFNIPGDWEKGENETGTRILQEEGIYNTSIIYCTHSSNRSYFIVGKQEMETYYPPQYFQENTLNRARAHYNLSSKEGSSEIIKLKDGTEASLSIARSNSTTANNFPINNTGAWIEILRPCWDIKNGKVVNLFYVIYFRIPNENWINVRDTLLSSFIDNISFSRKNFIIISPHVVGAIALLKENNFSIEYALTDVKTEPAPSLKVIEKIDSETILNFFKQSLKEVFTNDKSIEFMPDKRLAIASIKEGNAKLSIPNGEIYFENNKLIVYNKDTKRVQTEFDILNIEKREIGNSHLYFKYRKKNIKIIFNVLKNIRSYFEENFSKCQTNQKNRQ